MKQSLTPEHVRRYYAQRLPKLSQRGHQWRGKCPIHHGKDDNFAVKADTGKWFCHSQCGRGGSVVDLEMALTGTDFKTAVTRVESIVGIVQPTSPRAKKKIAATYDYVDENGKLLYQVVRHEPKGFIQRRLDERGEWVYKLGNTPRVPFRLPQLLAADTVIVVEGEKDVQSAERLGFTATCNSGGAGKWDPEYARYFAGKTVIVVPDNDEPGQDHAEAVAGSLLGVAREVRIVTVPTGKDLTDWITARATKEIIESAIKAASPIDPNAGQPEPVAPDNAEPQPDAPSREQGGDLPVIDITNRNLADLRQEVLDSLVSANEPPILFTRNGALVDVREGEAGRLILHDLIDIGLRGRMADTALYQHETRSGPQDCPPPLYVAKDILVYPSLRKTFPPIQAITEIPVFRPDGTVVDQVGYDSGTGLYYAPDAKLVIPPIPANPSAEDLRAALEVINSAIGDFPFVLDLDGKHNYIPSERREFTDAQYPSSRANTIAALLTQFMRPVINGPTPIGLIGAPSPGTGKGLLAEVIAMISTGRAAALYFAPEDEEEWRKQITSYLREGQDVIIFDNVCKPLESAQLCKAITATTWGDRILGHSRTGLYPVRCTWLATGNNIAVKGDMPRRRYWIYLDAQMRAPERRTGFRHANLRRWVLENRGSLIAALMTLARSWFAAGSPAGKPIVFGSFESWTATMTGILDHVGVPGFLANAAEFRGRADDATNEFEDLFIELHNIIGNKRFTSAHIHELCSQGQMSSTLRPLLPSHLAAALTDDNLFVRGLGRWLATIENRRLGSSQVHVTRCGMQHKVQLWRIVNPIAEVSGSVQ